MRWGRRRLWAERTRRSRALQRQLIDGPLIIDGDVHVEHELFKASPVESSLNGETLPTVVGLCIDPLSCADLERKSVAQVQPFLRRRSHLEGLPPRSAT
jgi:hypothetical protein